MEEIDFLKHGPARLELIGIQPVLLSPCPSCLHRWVCEHKRTVPLHYYIVECEEARDMIHEDTLYHSGS